MQIEIPDELIERAKKVLEYGVRKGYYSDVPADAGIERIFERIVAEDEKRVGWRVFVVPAYCLRFLGVQEQDAVEWWNKERGVVELRKAVKNDSEDRKLARKENKIVIEVRKGVVENVKNLPEGMDWDVEYNEDRT